MAGLLKKNLGSPDERRQFQAHGEVGIYNLGSEVVMRGRFDPGWRWASDVKPLAGTRSCEVAHALYVTAGRMRIRMDDGQEDEVGPGDVAFISPGHDAWVVGDESCLMVDFGDVGHYAQARLAPTTQPGADARAVH